MKGARGRVDDTSHFSSLSLPVYGVQGEKLFALSFLLRISALGTASSPAAMLRAARAAGMRAGPRLAGLWPRERQVAPA